MLYFMSVHTEVIDTHKNIIITFSIRRRAMILITVQNHVFNQELNSDVMYKWHKTHTPKQQQQQHVFRQEINHDAISSQDKLVLNYQKKQSCLQNPGNKHRASLDFQLCKQ